MSIYVLWLFGNLQKMNEVPIIDGYFIHLLNAHEVVFVPTSGYLDIQNGLDFLKLTGMIHIHAV